MAVAVVLNGVAFALSSLTGWIPGRRVIVNASCTLDDTFIANLNALEGAPFSASVALTSVEYRLDDGTLIGTSAAPGSVTVSVGALQRSAVGAGRLISALIPHYPATAYTGTAYCTDFRVIGSTVITDSAPTTPAGTSGGLYARYYNTTDLIGLPSYTGKEVPGFQLGHAAPHVGVTADFSARWTGFFRVPSSGKWRFNLLADDGMRLFIDGQLAIDAWVYGAGARSTGYLDLETGVDYPIWVEYFDGGANAGFIFEWQPLDGTSVAVPSSALYDTLPAAPVQQVIINSTHYVEDINRY